MCATVARPAYFSCRDQPAPMETLYLIFLLLLAVGASRILANVVPLPLPILQIIMGSLLALPPFGMGV